MSTDAVRRFALAVLLMLACFAFSCAVMFPAIAAFDLTDTQGSIVGTVAALCTAPVLVGGLNRIYP